MKKIIAALSLLLLSTSLFAWTIGPMNYQGRLLDDAGVPVTATLPFKVRIYDAASGGTLKFSEQHNSVAVDDGVYAFLVSTGSNSTGAWDIALWNTAQLFMEIEVNGETLSPRHLMAATPYAYQANLALTTNNALALGGKTAAEYNNVLGAICESSKGKWLEIVQKCLGAGSSFPGSATTALNTLTASTDLTNLDLNRADISGINFGTANLSGTSFDHATININGIKNANLSNTILTAFTSSGSAVVTANMSGAKLGAANLAGWNMSGATLTGASIADLSNCPSALPVDYLCVDHKLTPDGKKLLSGPNMNFSSTSLLNGRFNPSVVDNYNIGYVRNLSGSDFSKNSIEGTNQIFQNTNLSGADFSYANVLRTVFSGNLDGADFTGATINGGIFYSSMLGTVLVNADLTNVIFSPGNNSTLNFTAANLTNPVFTEGSTGLSLYFETSTLSNPTFASGITTLDVNESTKIFGGLYLGDQISYSYFMETYFSGGNISGNFTTAQFSYGQFYNVSFNGANFTGATGLQYASFVGVNWFGATCPDGYQVTTQGGSCIGHLVP
jgi:uncharacterized protein YjbI with pentapeptide repeats